MASNLTVDTLTKGATTLNTDELVDVNNTRVAKAWVNFNGTGVVAIRASYNISSVTDNGTGDYTVNFTTAMSDVNYSGVLSTTGGNTGTNQLRIMQVLGADAAGALTKTASTLRIVRGQSNATGSFVDGAEINVQIFR